MKNNLAAKLCKQAGRILGYSPPGPEPFRLTFASGPQEAARSNAYTGRRPAEDGQGGQATGVAPPGPALEENLDIISRLFHYPANKDLVLRRFTLDLTPPVRAAAVYLEGMCDKKLQDQEIFSPLMVWAGGRPDAPSDLICDLVQHNLLPASQVIQARDWQAVIEGIANGQTALFIDACSVVLLAETKGWDKRSVESPKTETVLRGPQEGFNETLRSNTALLRRRLRNPNLITETVRLGQVSATTCAVMYLDGVANPFLVAEVKRRLNGIRTDYVADSGTLEQFIEDSYWFPFPTLLATERPDRVAAMLAEGRVAIALDGDPFVLVAPMTLFPLLHSAEDTGVRWPFGIFQRFVRTVAAIAALFLPGLYLALINFHQEMIPTDLLFSIAGSRERVPFPSVIELLVMEVSFELVREAGVRVPGVIGQTIGIVGALILGQAAVSAAIVSPITVIAVAVTALGSFAIPSHGLGFSLRLGRFLFIILGATYGFIGIALGLFIIALAMSGLNSFGVPYLSPVGPSMKASADILYRDPVWNQEIRPPHLEPVDGRRQPKKSRPWRRGGKQS